MDKAAGVNVYYAVAKRLFAKLTHEAVWGPEGISPLKRFKEGETAYIAMCPNPSHQGARQSFIMPKAWPGGSWSDVRVSGQLADNGRKESGLAPGWRGASGSERGR